MKSNRMSVIVLTVALSFSLISKGMSQTTGAAFLTNDHTPQAYSMGMSDVMTSWGSQAVGANPANLGMMGSRFEMYTSYATLSDGMQYGHVAGAFALNSKYVPLDAVGVSATREAVGGISGTDASGNSTGSFGAQDMAFALSGSKRIGGLSMGLTGKAIQQKIAGYTSNTALAADLGANYTMKQFHNVSVGLSVNNMGQGIGYLGQKDPLPTTANLGASVPVGPAVGVLTVSREMAGQRTDVGVGMAYNLGPMEFRGGYMAQGGGAQNLALKDQSGMGQLMNGLSGGLGIRMGSARLDYAVSEGAVELGATQRLSLTLAWGEQSVLEQPTSSRKSTMRKQNSNFNSDSDSIDWHMINVQQQ